LALLQGKCARSWPTPSRGCSPGNFPNRDRSATMKLPTSIASSSLVVKLRGPVARDRYTREIEAVYGEEGPGRIGLTLERLLAGLDTLGVERETALDVIEAVAMDSVPPIRRRAYEYVSSDDPVITTVRDDGSGAVICSGIATSTVGKELGLPTNTVRRALEDLAAYRLVMRIKAKENLDLWKATGRR
jgi:hypothetical protein